MAHIGIHRVEDIARRHLARILQIDAMPPQMTRGDFNTWDFNRAPFHHREVVPIRRLRRADIQEQMGQPSGGFPVGEMLGERAMTEHGHERRTYILNFDKAVLPDLTFLVTSSPAVPFPFNLVNATFTGISTTGAGKPNWNVAISDQEYLNDIVGVLPNGKMLFDVPFVGDVTDNYFQGTIGHYYYDATQVNITQDSSSGPHPAGHRVSGVYSPGISGGNSAIRAQMIIIVESTTTSLNEMGLLPSPTEGAPPTVATPTEPLPWEEIF